MGTGKREIEKITEKKLNILKIAIVGILVILVIVRNIFFSKK